MLASEKQWLFEEYLSGNIDVDAYRARKSTYDDRLQQTKNAYAVLTAQAKSQKDIAEKQSLAGQAMEELNQSGILSNTLVDQLIDKVNVFPGNGIQIVYKIQDFLIVIRVYLKTVSMPKQGFFFRCAAAFFLEIQPVFLKKMLCTS